VVPAKAQAVMSRFDDRSAHYETIVPTAVGNLVTSWPNRRVNRTASALRASAAG
jgi:hypothetical protein